MPVNAHKKSAFDDTIRKYGLFAFLTSSACIIWTNATVVEVRDTLLKEMGAGDKLYVGETTAPAAWNNMTKEVSDYIKANLK